jgi:osmoprotectant transport system ATP-binding protein
VELDHVSKRYGRASSESVAVHELSLVVQPGEVCVLVGPSGCGKTTTLRMVNRLVEPSDGRILIDGRDTSVIPATELRRGIGYVIQQIGLFPHQTIAQNVATVPRLLGWEETRTAARVDELLDLVGLPPDRYRARYPSELSGGERQRVGVARALAIEPPLMLMDEPFGAVDPVVREHLQDEFLRLHQQLGMTVLLVTHDIDEAIKLGDRVAILKQGGILAQYATPSELLARPADDFVARFVGSDRELKRLSLMTVGSAQPVDLPVVRLAELPDGVLADDRRGDYDGAVLLDPSGRPQGWSHTDGAAPSVEAARAIPMVPQSMTLREALSLLLGSDPPLGCIIDSEGEYSGGLTMASISAALRDEPVDLASTATSEAKP